MSFDPTPLYGGGLAPREMHTNLLFCISHVGLQPYQVLRGLVKSTYMISMTKITEKRQKKKKEKKIFDKHYVTACLSVPHRSVLSICLNKNK